MPAKQSGKHLAGAEIEHQIAPHADIELGYARNQLDYFVTVPEDGIDAETGVLLVIPGWGDRADTPYQRDKLRPYLADKYNCLAVGVNYFSIKTRLADSGRLGFQFPQGDQFVGHVAHLYGIAPGEYCGPDGVNCERLSQALLRRGVRNAAVELRLQRVVGGMQPEYESFGLLPAIDHLTVLADVIRHYAVNLRRVAAFGSSYGGYIAMLLGKFAPATFAVIVENSGFIVTRVQEIASTEFYGVTGQETLFGVTYPTIMPSPWSICDETLPNYFSDGHRDIRSLLVASHQRQTDTRYHLFHSIDDELVPIQQKDACVSLLRRHGVTVHYTRVTEADVDGALFKTKAHGMDASLRKLFDRAMATDGSGLTKAVACNDFSENATQVFDCGDRSHVFQYSNTPAVSVSVRRR